MIVKFEVNDQGVEVDAREGQTLLEILRNQLGITSAKDGCSGQGQCGACTVQIDGVPRMACQQAATKMGGRRVLTLEGLPETERTVLADAFVETGGLQCGFCTPGILMRTKGLLDRDSAPSRAKIARKLSPHLCRCTGYTAILDGVELAASRWSSEAGAERSRAVPVGHGVGDSARRVLGRKLALGEKDYIADMAIEGMLEGALVLAPRARAEIKAIDTSVAEAVEGVERIFVAADVPGQRTVGLVVEDWPIFVAAGETTRCVGDVLALVVARDALTARRAAKLVEVDFTELPPLVSPEAALEPDAPVLHPDLRSSNLLDVAVLRRGDLARARQQATHVVRRHFSTQRVEHAFLEPESCIVQPQTGGVRVYTQGQGVNDDRRQIASVLGLPLERVHVELVSNGGGFGGKEDLSVQAHAALAAHLLGLPVRVALSRDESIRVHPKRHPIEMDFEAGVDADGHLKFVWARMVGDTGAHASVGMKVLERAVGHACGPYRVDAVDIEAKTVYTNNVTCGAFRGFGVNQSAFAIEGMLDELGELAGLDGYQVRERNVLDPGDVYATGQIMDAGCGIRQTLEAAKASYYGAERAGIACGIKNTGIGNGKPDIGRVLLQVLGEDRIRLATGFTEMGQGLFTVLIQIVCEETGLEPELFEPTTSTDFAVQCGMTTASRATVLAGTAARRAGVKLAADLGGAGLADLVGRGYDGEYVCDFTTELGASTQANPVTHLTFGYATQVVVVDDEGRIERVVAAHDVGKAINPTLCRGQIEGAIVMGLGYALTEDLPCVDGAPVAQKIGELGLLRAKHVPPIDVILVEVADLHGPYGAKGVGEIGLVPTAPAVASALYAFDGVRRRRLPMDDSPAAAALGIQKPRSSAH